jgi:hypothetical protein
MGRQNTASCGERCAIKLQPLPILNVAAAALLLQTFALDQPTYYCTEQTQLHTHILHSACRWLAHVQVLQAEGSCKLHGSLLHLLT